MCEIHQPESMSAHHNFNARKSILQEMPTRRHEVNSIRLPELELLKLCSTPRQEIEVGGKYLLFSLNHPKGVFQLKRNHRKSFTMLHICFNDI